jgi:hypothetical protein
VAFVEHHDVIERSRRVEAMTRSAKGARGAMTTWRTPMRSGALVHLTGIGTESDFLAFDPGDRELNVAGKKAPVRAYRESPVRLRLVAPADHDLAGTLTLSGPARPRIRHTGELGMSVRRTYWDLGMGS